MKKKVIGMVSVALFVGGLYINQAQGASPQQRYDQAVEVACDATKQFAYDVMILRQTPISEDVQVQLIKDIGIQKRAEDKALEIVTEAHKRPVAEPDMVNMVSTSFSYDMQDKCLSEMSGKFL